METPSIGCSAKEVTILLLLSRSARNFKKNMTFVHEVVNSGKSKNKNQNQDAIHFKNGLYREEYTAPYSLYGPNGVYSSTKEENCFFWWGRT